MAAVRRSARLAVTKDWNGRVEWQGRDSASKTASVAGKLIWLTARGLNSSPCGPHHGES